MIGLAIDIERLGRIATAQAARVQAEEVAGTNGGTVTRYVSPEVLASTGERYEGCRCEDLGLVAGMPVSALVELEAGCTGNPGRSIMSGEPMSHRDRPGWVCERLNAVRRSYGL